VNAVLACALLIDEIQTLVESNRDLRDITREFSAGWVERFHREVDARAEEERLRRRDYACTLLAAIIGPDCAAFLQVGDGAIVVPSPEGPDDYMWLFWPQKGEYENLTLFLSDATAGDHMNHAFCERRIDEVALFSDGLQRLALHFSTQTVHDGFFRPMFAPVRAAPEGASVALSSALATFLDRSRLTSEPTTISRSS
jgi:hypothetical protein